MRRTFVLLAVAIAGGTGAVAPGFAQSAGTTGEFSYSPEAQQRGGSVTITGKCVIEGQTSNVDMVVAIRQGANGQGETLISKVFTPTSSGAINGTVEVPGDAAFGEYIISGTCRNGPNSFFSKSGPFTVGDRPSVTATTEPRATTTTAPGLTAAPATTSTTGPEATTTTTEAVVDIVEVPSTTDTTDAIDDIGAGPTTTIDEFAGTRNDDDNDSIGSLLLLFGAVPLLLAVVAVGLTLRRRNAAPVDA